MNEYGMPTLSYHCATEEIIYPSVPDGVMSRSDWHALCMADDCECPEHGKE